MCLSCYYFCCGVLATIKTNLCKYLIYSYLNLLFTILLKLQKLFTDGFKQVYSCLENAQIVECFYM